MMINSVLKNRETQIEARSLRDFFKCGKHLKNAWQTFDGISQRV